MAGTELAIDSAERSLLEAAARAHARHGYAATDGKLIASEAGVPPAAFAALFESPLACLAAAQRFAFDRFEKLLRDSWRVEGGWPAQVVSGAGAGLEFASSEPDLAAMLTPSSLLLEPVLASGVWATTDFLAAALRSGSRRYAGARAVTPLYEKVLVGGVQGLVATELRTGRAGQLTKLHEEVAAVILTPYLGISEASRYASVSPGARY